MVIAITVSFSKDFRPFRHEILTQKMFPGKIILQKDLFFFTIFLSLSTDLHFYERSGVQM